MTTYIDENGAYLLDRASDADSRRRLGIAQAFADSLTVASTGKFAYVQGHESKVLYLPHTGEERPRPQL